MAESSAPSISAPEVAIHLTDDGGVCKLVVREGTGDIPPLHSRCIAGSGSIFMDTKEAGSSGQPVTVVAGRDSSTTERGLHLAVSTMCVGERAHLWTASSYGYGARGNFSFPTIPPDTDLIYDIELLDFEPPTEGKSHSDMTFEERLESAERRRLEGNELYKSEQYEEALGRYSVALSFVDEDLMIQVQGFHYDKAIATRVPALLNSSACHLKLGDYNAAISSASQVLTEQPGNAKALFRRGTARNALGQTDAALQDLAAAKKAAPGDPAIARELHAVLKSMKEQRQAGANLFRGLLDKEDAKELYSDQEEEENEERNVSTREKDGHSGGGDGAPQGFFASFMQVLCPFIFGRPKYHEQ
ncbi:putative Peptidyl-prolyl cis-trans isomerase FKBP42 [Nannochloris sp. 'desiccata']|nr:hypothetical protein KSW81_001765 [Chlorella desiccata (nom. nud.)]KAH7616198.1 putative Peptidyl-prolyl cis-trans isomerase FKBP42 [Chlorella desiccata (nom. nud.)]